jgi:tRNA threonylcarbamoyl adenosine modification protein (Sua5/YciO/YrdC/YwlC family)
MKDHNSSVYKAQLLMPTDENIYQAAKKLRNGELVAFPTETVYGLGGNALNENAIQKIFLAKGRPLTNPLIVHVASMEMVMPILELNSSQQKLFKCLANNFWPGPLTIVAKAAPHMSRLLTADGSYVGVRYPNHKITLDLISHANVPVAGPSANRSGHVSPTCSEHVLTDLGHVDLTILDGGQCQVGIESTVVKIDESCELFMLRRGIITSNMIEEALKRDGHSKKVNIVDAHTTSMAFKQQAPGQLLTHYAPKISAYILRTNKDEHYTEKADFTINKCVVIDLGGAKVELAPHAAFYTDLSISGKALEAATNLFRLLRLAEEMPGVDAVILPDLAQINDDVLRGVFDRIYRSASGRYTWIDKNNDIFLSPTIMT